MKKERHTATLLLLAAPAFFMPAQVPQDPTYGMTPNAKSLQRYGDIPVSLYTGTPDISIPLATLRQGSLTLPVSLSYHSGGIKVDCHPGWTGLGWTLIAGGAITREIRDMADEVPTWGYMDSAAELSLDKINSANISGVIAGPDGDVFHDKDTEPDKFNFSFPGYSGFFMLGADGRWAVSCDRPIRVESDAPVTPAVRFANGARTKETAERIYPRFVLTADDGVRYVFGSDAVELSINSANQYKEEWEVTAWYLTEIRHPNGDAIKLNYKRGDFVVEFSNSRISASSDRYGFVSFGGVSGQLISPVYLESISAENFNVSLRSSPSKELDYSGADYLRRATSMDMTSYRMPYCPYNSSNTMMDEVNWRQLDRIVFKSGRSVIYRTIDFDYSESDKQRLTLQGVTVSGFGGEASEKYRFGYDNMAGLPQYLSGHNDHWGYYSDLPASADSNGARPTDPLRTGYGVLTQITYPTGGMTQLEFEPNSYSEIFNGMEQKDETGLAGGVRIKRILNIPKDGTAPEIRRFVYTSSYDPDKDPDKCPGNGVLEGKPVYSHTMPYSIGGSTIYINEESNRSLSSIINHCGFHIGYPTVYELMNDGGYTEHLFISATYPGLRDEAPMLASDMKDFVPYSSKAPYRGKPAGITRFDAQGRCVMSESIGYGIIGGPERWIPSLSFTARIIYNQENSSVRPLYYYKYSLYRNYIHSMAETYREVRYYGTDPGRPHSIYHHKRYNTLGQLVSDSVVTMSGGKPVSDVTSYSYMWEDDDIYADNHFKSYVSDIVRCHNGKTVSHLSNTRTLYGGRFPLLTRVEEMYDGSDRFRLYELGRSDSIGTPVQVRNADGLYTVYLWGAERMYPVAEIRNADASQVRKVLGYDPEDAPRDADIQKSIARLRAGMPHAMVTSYTYIPYLGITSMTDPAGKTTYYGYDLQGRLTEIRDDNGDLIKQYQYETVSGRSAGTSFTLPQIQSEL